MKKLTFDETTFREMQNYLQGKDAGSSYEPQVHIRDEQNTRLFAIIKKDSIGFYTGQASELYIELGKFPEMSIAEARKAAATYFRTCNS